MLEKLSVRKPFTVLVGVVLIIVLGTVSFMNTSTDLFPSMDLPFAAIFTTYIGATPEEVEMEVSIPIETGMSTLTGIEMVQSISNEHVSIIILQFTETTNMDSASLEIREALDLIGLPDGAGRPMTIRMNPEMLPIITAAVHMEGVDIDELSVLAKSTIAPALETVPGVAVVNFSGLVQNQLHVVLRREKVDEVNAQMADAVAAMMEAAMAEMAAQAELAIAGQVGEFWANREQELLMEGLTLEEAVAVIEMELPFVIQAITEEVEQEMAERMPEQDEAQVVGIPAEMLSVDTVMGMLFAQNFAMPAGMILDDGDEILVRVGNTFDSVDDIKTLIIFDPSQMGLFGMEPVRLQDVAEIFETDDRALTFSRVNGDPSIMLSIQRQSEFTTADIASSVRNRMDSLSAEINGLGFVILMDQGEMIDMVLSSVLGNLFYGGLLAILVLFVFLRDIRPTLIVAASIPLSLMLAFTLMFFTGVSLNLISMGGLALAVGMLVDNSIIVIENIYRMRSTTGRSAARSAVSGTRQVSGAIVASTLSTVSVFLPIVFTEGITRQLFTDFGLTIGFALLASLIIAFTVVPAASSTLFGGVKHNEGKYFVRFVDGYEKLLRLSLRFKPVVLVVAVVLFAFSIWAIGRQGTQMFPPMDAPQITVTANMMYEATFEEATVVAEEFSRRVLALPEVETVGVNVGGGGMLAMLGMGFGGDGGGQSTVINMYVLMEDGRSLTNDEISLKIMDAGEGLGIYVDVAGGDAGMEMLTGPQISLRVEGTDLDAIRDTAIRLAEMLSTVDGAENITDITGRAPYELRVSVDRNAAMAHGLTVAQVFMAVNEAISAPERSMEITLEGRNIEIIVNDGDFERPDALGISEMSIGGVRLADIAEIYYDLGFTSINRMNRNRFISINGEVGAGFNVGLVNAEIENRLLDFVPEAGVSVVVGGEAEAIAEAFQDLFLMLALGLVFIYLIMVAQFQSLLAPFIIMFTIPLAFTGGFAALVFVGMPLSIVAMIGLILLAGVVVNNGIVFISRLNQMRWEGMPKLDAIIDAGRKRIRPIIMTAISTIFAMSVLAIGFGEGAEMMQPMAVATIGGLSYATLMTLFVVPILYDLFHRNRDVTKEDLEEEAAN